MISPYSPDKIVVNGKSWGASGASYDVRIACDLVLGVNPAYIIARHIKQLPESSFKSPIRLLLAYARLRNELRANPPMKALANTMEDFHMPDDVSADVADKSTYARLFVSAYNTFFDPGFIGNGTLELVNDNDAPMVLKRGDPICQFVFTQCTQPTSRPYSTNGGKYSGQQGQTPAILEDSHSVISDFIVG